MTKQDIVWNRVPSRIDGDEKLIDVLIAAVPGGHLVSTNAGGAAGLCFVPGKTHAIGKLIARAKQEKAKAKPGKKKKPEGKNRR